MGVTSLVKQKGGAALIQNFKNIFPGQINKLYIYRGTNLLSKGENIIAREDYQTTISLTLIKEVDVVYGGENFAATARTIQEEKQIKELTRDIVNASSATAFIKDLGDLDLNDASIYYTLGSPFIQSDNKIDQLKVMTFNNIVPNVLTKLVTGTSTLTPIQRNLITNNLNISFSFTPALLDDTLAGSKMKFVDGSIYKKIPVDETDFEITSIEIKSDQTLMLEYGNGIKTRGIIETQSGTLEEIDIDVKSNKPLMPLIINPYAKKGNLQFAIGNFNKFLFMPWLYAKKFLSADKNIEGYITQGDTSAEAIALVQAVVDMFKLSHAFSTNFAEYRDNNGDVKDETIGGVALKALENKDAVASVDAVMKNFEYTYPQFLENQAYVRALQILAASSQYISSSYCIAKGLNQFHKSLLDFYLRLDTKVDSTTTRVDMTLQSLRYTFTYEKDQNGNNDLDKPIINLNNLLSQSEVIVDETDRYTSLPEIDDPVSVSTFVTFAGDIDSTNQQSLKYKVAVDITDPDKIAEFFINEETSNEKIITKTPAVDTNWVVKEKPANPSGKTLGDILPNQSIVGTPIEGNDSLNDIDKLILSSASIPTNAYDVSVISRGTTTETTQRIKWSATELTGGTYLPGVGRPTTVTVATNLIRYAGAVVQYKIKTTSHGVKNKVVTYNKGTYFNMIKSFSDDEVWKRTFTISDDYRNDQGKSNVKIKSIDRIYLSFLLGNYVDISLNYQYTQTTQIANDPSNVVKVPVTQINKIGNDPASAKSITTNIVVTETELLPRIELPSKNDETRSKLGISL